MLPDFTIEDVYDGPVCGFDEAGRGPLVGPVYAACVYFPPEARALEFTSAIRDSKKLSPQKRNTLAALIKTHCVYGIGSACPREIEQQNILKATFLAMERAFMQSGLAQGMHGLIDGNRLPALFPCPASAIIRGDARSMSIAAASILAKTERDSVLKALALDHPHYGWERNSGYPTAEHLAAIDIHGITPHHRKTYAPVAMRLERTDRKTA